MSNWDGRKEKGIPVGMLLDQKRVRGEVATGGRGYSERADVRWTSLSLLL